jgi:hypothetical protein
VRAGQVPPEGLPGTRAVVPGHQRFQQQQPVGDGQHVRSRQLPGAAQRGEPIGLSQEQFRGRAVDDLADGGHTVGPGDQPGVSDDPAGQPPQGGDAVRAPDLPQRRAQGIVAVPLGH